MPVGFEYAGTDFTVGLLQLANVPMEEISSSVQTPMMEEPTKEADSGGEFGVPVTGSIRVRRIRPVCRSVHHTGTERLMRQHCQGSGVMNIPEGAELETVEQDKLVFRSGQRKPVLQEAIKWEMEGVENRQIVAGGVGEEAWKDLSERGIQEPFVVPKGSQPAISKTDSGEGSVPRKFGS